MHRKYIIFSAVCFVCFAFLLVYSCAKQESTEFDSFSEIRENFKNPPVEFHSAPLTVWNDKVTDEKVVEQIMKLHSQGIGGVLIHPRYGMITPYLTDEYFSLYKTAFDKVKELGMKMWIYDENGYPSGYAGGYVRDEMPEAAGKALVLRQYDVLPDNIKGEISVVLKKENSGYVDVTDRLGDEKSKSGKYYVYTLVSNLSNRYLDLLMKGVTEKFLEVTFEKGYKKYFGHEFGKMIPGSFQDEADISPLVNGAIKWTPDLYAEFEKMWGYDLRVHLPSLLEDVGEWKKNRHNYYAVLLHLFVERWAKVYYNYCEENNLKFTGHYWENWWPRPARCPDNMAMYQWAQMPGVDILDNVYSDDSRAQREKAQKMGRYGYQLLQVGNVRAVKELRSAANQMGYRRTLSETYGRSGWDLRFEDMKRIADWEYAVGVNFLNQHLFQMTLKGARKQDNPPSFYHQPYWQFYHYFENYTSRLSLVLSSGEQINKILVIEPTTSAWMYYAPPRRGRVVADLGTVEEKTEKYLALGDDFQDFVTDLSKLHVDYDLGSEKIINDVGAVKNGKFVVGERTYDILVLPPGLENLNSTTAALLETYLNEGGKVISFVEPPKYIDGSETDRFSKLASEHAEKWLKSDRLNGLIAAELLASEGFQTVFEEKAGNKLYHHRRQLKDGEILFLANSNIEESIAGEININGQSVYELNLFTGDISPYPAESKGGLLSMDFDLPPIGSLLLYISPTASAASVGDGEPGRILSPDTEVRVERLEPNILTIDYCDIKIDGKMEKGLYTNRAQRRVYQNFGFDRNPWYGRYQFKTEIVDRDNFPANSGFEAVFSFQVDKGTDMASLKAVVEQPDIFKVSVNGSPVKPLPGEEWLDYAFSIYDIGDFAVPGNNEIKLTVSPFTVYAELESIYILGNFGLRSQSKGWKVVPSSPLSMGAWDKQAMPFYSDGVSYSKKYSVSSKDKKHIVQLGKWLGAVAEVRVNEEHAGIIGWPPYSLDISDKIIDGENEISVIVYGSLNNALGPHHYSFRGRTGPSTFDVAPEKQPEGEKYNFIGYGLFDDFSVIEK